MKKFLTIAAFSFLALSTYAQKGSDYIGLAGDLAIGSGEFGDGLGAGFGVSARGLLGVGKSGQVTLTTGFNGFSARAQLFDIDVKTKFTIIPILLGYRHNIKGFYFEPRLGVGIYGAKVDGTLDGEDISEKDNQAAFTWAIGAGYATTKGLEIGLRYQSGQVESTNMAIFGVHIGYNFNLHGKK